MTNRKVHICILRRLQNFMKSSPYFWRALHRTNVGWRFFQNFVAFSEYVNFMTQPPFSLHTSNSRTISSLRYLEKSLVNCLWTLSSKNAYLCNPNILRNLLWWFLTQSAVECIKLGHSEVWFFTHLLDLTRLI